MFTNRTKSGRANIVGINIARMRKQLKLSQREVADRLTAIGLTIDKNAIQRMDGNRIAIYHRQLADKYRKTYLSLTFSSHHLIT